MTRIALLGLATTLSAALAIRAEQAGARRQVYLLKPLTTLLVLAACLASGPANGEEYRAWIAAGLVLSLAGDVFLMLPRDRFVAGLASFLLAHLAYLAALSGGFELRLTPWALGVYAVAAGGMMTVLHPHLGRLRAPVVVYTVALGMMAWMAAERWVALGTPGAASAAAGAALFVVSDAALAVNRFVRPFRLAQPLVLSTYWAAQWLIATSV